MGDAGPVLCRYFASGCCRQGDRCVFSHDRNQRADMVCRFYVKGNCNYGTACRYDHVKPKTNKAAPEPPKKAFSVPKPVKLAKPGLNTEAVEFVPSWKKLPQGASYSCAAGGTESGTVDERLKKDIPLCPYQEEKGECKDPNCKFIHGETCEYCNRDCLNPYDEEQRKQHTKECVEGHQMAMEAAFIEARGVGKMCGICMDNILEKSLRFGILNGCRHCFCLECIRQWRRNNNFDAKVVRSCPECRQHSDFVIPSTIWVEDENEKQVLLELFKENTGQKQCKYYKDRTTGIHCPFGNKCFYKHQLPDGTIDPGESPHTRRKPLLSDFLFPFSDDESEDESSDEFYARIIEHLRMI